MTFDSDNLGGSPVGLEDLGLGDSISDSHGNKGSGATDFWGDDKSDLRKSLGLNNEPEPTETSITQDEYDEYLKFKKAKESGDLKTLLELGQGAKGSQKDDNAQSLHSEIESLKQQLAEVGQWKTDKQKAEEQQKQQEKISGVQAKVKELVNSEQFSLVDKYGHFDTVWMAGKNFAKEMQRAPTKNEWLKIAVDVENSLRKEAKGIRELDIPLEELDLSGVLGVNSDTNAPQKPASNAHQGINRPTIRNGDTAQTAPKAAGDVDMSVEARRERAARALAALRR